MKVDAKNVSDPSEHCAIQDNTYAVRDSRHQNARSQRYEKFLNPQQFLRFSDQRFLKDRPLEKVSCPQQKHLCLVSRNRSLSYDHVYQKVRALRRRMGHTQCCYGEIYQSLIGCTKHYAQKPPPGEARSLLYIRGAPKKELCKDCW